MNKPDKSHSTYIARCLTKELLSLSLLLFLGGLVVSCNLFDKNKKIVEFASQLECAMSEDEIIARAEERGLESHFDGPPNWPSSVAYRNTFVEFLFDDSGLACYQIHWNDAPMHLTYDPVVSVCNQPDHCEDFGVDAIGDP